MKKLFLLFTLIVSLNTLAQISDQYNNPALWAEVDDPLGRMGFFGNRLRWTLTWNDIPNIQQSNLRCSRNLNNLISSSTNFRVALTYRIITALQTGTTVLAITENNTQSLVTRLTNTTFNCTQNSSITINMNGNAFFIQIKPSGAVTQNSATCNPIFQQQINFNPILNTDYRIELTQIGSRYRFRVLNPTTNAELVNQVFCSPVVPSNLNLIQHGNHPWAGVNGGQLEVDDLLVENAVTDPTINAFPTVAINGPTGVCELDDQPITLTAIAAGGTFSWANPPTNGPNLVVTLPGTYTVTATVNNCINTATANILDNCPPGCEDPCSWSKTGNNAITSNNFLGTRNNADLTFRTNKKLNLRLNANGHLTINEGKSFMFGKLTKNSTDNRWGIEEFDGGLNFWKPWPSAHSGNYKIHIHDMGHVSIGKKSNPWVQKSTGFLGLTQVQNFKLQVHGNAISDDWFTWSDEKIKNNIEENTKVLSKLEDLISISYNYDISKMEEHFASDNIKNIEKSELDKLIDEKRAAVKHFGFTAQNVEKVFPNLVDEIAGLKVVNYVGLVPMLTQAIKELNAKVDKQNNAVIENEELKSKVSQLESKLAMQDEKFALLEKTITQLCESGCAGLEKKVDADVLYQSIPNPTDDVALINYSLSSEYREASITLSSQDGKQLMTLKLDAKKGSGSVKVSLGDLASGTYLYTLVAANKVIDTKRLQIVK